MNSKELRMAMLTDLARSGLDEKDVKLLKLSTQPHTLKPAAAGYTIPYFDIDGHPTKFYRVRYVESTSTGFQILSGQKPQRYSQPPKSVNEVYLPPYVDWREVLFGKEPLIITEGEKKAAVATKHHLPTLGLGGVWCFMSTRAEQQLLPIFDDINLNGRTITICFDSDAATNINILKAEQALAKRLTAKGAVVLIARIPHKHGKRGIDDYIQEFSAAKFRKNIIAKAFPYAEELHDMNSKFIYIHANDVVYDRERGRQINPTVFRQNAYCNLWIETTTHGPDDKLRIVNKPAAKLWLEWPHRAELDGITYAPGQPQVTDDGKLNTWKGWGVEDAVKGDIQPWHDLLDNLFGEQREARKWFEQWCAYPIQHPGSKMASAVLMWGAGQGTGKTLCGTTLMNLYGENATEVKDSDLENPRNAWAEHKQFVLADDITGQDNRKLANKFKTMITQKTIHIDQKYVKAYSVPDCINYYFTSNDPTAFHLDEKDRRFFVHEVLSEGLPEALRKRYVAWMHSKAGMEALFHYLLTMSLNGFDPQAPAMKTEAKKDMTVISKSELGAWVTKLMDDPNSILGPAKAKGDLFTAEKLFTLFDKLEVKRSSPNALARELKRSGVLQVTTRTGGPVSIGDRRLRIYAVRNPDKWKTASTKEIAEHYTQHNSMITPKEKF